MEYLSAKELASKLNPQQAAVSHSKQNNNMGVSQSKDAFLQILDNSSKKAEPKLEAKVKPEREEEKQKLAVKEDDKQVEGIKEEKPHKRADEVRDQKEGSEVSTQNEDKKTIEKDGQAVTKADQATQAKKETTTTDKAPITQEATDNTVIAANDKAVLLTEQQNPLHLIMQTDDTLLSSQQTPFTNLEPMLNPQNHLQMSGKNIQGEVTLNSEVKATNTLETTLPEQGKDTPLQDITLHLQEGVIPVVIEAKPEAIIKDTPIEVKEASTQRFGFRDISLQTPETMFGFKFAGANPQLQQTNNQIFAPNISQIAQAALVQKPVEGSATPSTLSSTPSMQTSLTQTNLLHQATELPKQDLSKPQFTPRIASSFEHIAVHIQKASQTGQNRIEIQLLPANLGKVDIELSFMKDGLKAAHIVVERQETLDMLQKDVKQIESIFKNMGLDVEQGTLQFSLKQQFLDQQGKHGHIVHQGMSKANVSEQDVMQQETTRNTSHYYDGLISLEV